MIKKIRLQSTCSCCLRGTCLARRERVFQGGVVIRTAGRGGGNSPTVWLTFASPRLALPCVRACVCVCVSSLLLSTAGWFCSSIFVAVGTHTPLKNYTSKYMQHGRTNPTVQHSKGLPRVPHLSKIRPILREGQQVHRPAQRSRARVLPGEQQRDGLKPSAVTNRNKTTQSTNGLVAIGVPGIKGLVHAAACSARMGKVTASRLLIGNHKAFVFPSKGLSAAQ